jgi:hypothetical protein
LSALLLAGVLPVLASCAMLTGTTPKTATSTPTPGKIWSIYAQGSPSASAAPGAAGGATTATASATAAHPTYTRTYTWAAGECPGQIRQGQPQGLTVTPGSGTAKISWYNAQGSKVLSYHVQAVSQHLIAGPQPSHPAVSTTPGTGCQVLTTTITGLNHGEYYVFWLDAAVVLPNADGISNKVRDWVVGESTTVLVP